jgi:hypothetical protein
VCTVHCIGCNLWWKKYNICYMVVFMKSILIHGIDIHFNIIIRNTKYKNKLKILCLLLLLKRFVFVGFLYN